MALGIGTNAEQTVILIIALASHKWIEAFAFSTSFVKEGVPVRRWIGILLMYSLMTPLGITGGIFLSDYLSGDNAILAEVRVQPLTIRRVTCVARRAAVTALAHDKAR